MQTTTVTEAVAAAIGVKLRPFHKTIVEVLLLASSRFELECLGHFIMKTEVPANHDEIIAAWNTRRREMAWGTIDLGVPAYLLEQKQAALTKAGE